MRIFMYLILLLLSIISTSASSFETITGNVEVDVNFLGDPITMYYVLKSNYKSHGTIVLIDDNLGTNGWSKFQQHYASVNIDAKASPVTISFDLVEYGNSSKQIAGGTRCCDNANVPQQMAYWLHQAITKLRLKQPIYFVGTTSGAHIGIHYHLLYDSSTYRFEKMIFESASLHTIVHSNPRESYFHIDPFFMYWYRYYLECDLNKNPNILHEMYDKFFDSTTMSKEESLALEKQAKTYIRDMPTAIMSSIMVSFYLDDLRELADKVTIPVYIIYCGKNSPSYSVPCKEQTSYWQYLGFPDMCEEVFSPISHYHLDIPNVQWQIMPNHSSATHITNFEEYIKIVDEFLLEESYIDMAIRKLYEINGITYNPNIFLSLDEWLDDEDESPIEYRNIQVFELGGEYVLDRTYMLEDYLEVCLVPGVDNIFGPEGYETCFDDFYFDD